MTMYTANPFLRSGKRFKFCKSMKKIAEKTISSRKAEISSVFVHSFSTGSVIIPGLAVRKSTRMAISDCA